jgi:hypothetical protein
MGVHTGTKTLLVGSRAVEIADVHVSKHSLHNAQIRGHGHSMHMLCRLQVIGSEADLDTSRMVGYGDMKTAQCAERRQYLCCWIDFREGEKAKTVR